VPGAIAAVAAMEALVRNPSLLRIDLSKLSP
jgi:hypothetical protein